MRISILMGFVTIIASVFIINYILTIFISTNIKCTAQGELLNCEFRELGVPVVIGVSFVAGFVIIDTITVYIIIKSWLYISGLKIRYNEIKKLKDAVEKNYYKKKIDENTFNNLIQSYEKELVELEVRIKRLK